MVQRRRQADLLSARSLFAFGWSYIKDIALTLKLAIWRWQMDDAASMAAAVAYYLALSLFPMLLMLSSGLGIFLRYTTFGHDAEQHILAIVAEHCSPSLETQVRSIVIGFEDQSLVSGPFGLIASVLAAIGVFFHFERAFDKIWRIPPPPRQTLLRSAARLLTQRLTAFLLLLSVGIGITAILAVNVVVGILQEWMTSLSLVGNILILLVDATTTLILNSLAFATLYRWLPKRPVAWKHALRSGLLAALIWEVGRHVLGAFLIGMKYSTTYGAIGSFIAILLWFYWGVTILFFGAEYLQVLTQRHSKPLKMFSPIEQETPIDSTSLNGSTIPARARRRADDRQAA